MKLKFWGTRGSIPVPGVKTLRYGGNTPCLQIKNNSGINIIFDCGTGIRPLGNELLGKDDDKNIKIFLTHTHWDHIQGIPFFTPLFKNFNIDFYLNSLSTMRLDDVINAQFRENFFPVNAEEVFQSKLTFNKIYSGSKIRFDELTIESISIHHSEGTLAYKLEENGKTLIYMTDNEIYYDTSQKSISNENLMNMNEDLISFCRGADYLVHDCMYFYSDYKDKIGWGHSNNKVLAYFSNLCEIKNLILFHYDPDYSDDLIDKLLDQTKNYLDEINSDVHCTASYEGLEMEI